MAPNCCLVQIGSAVILVLSIVLLIVSTATKYWITVSGEDFTAHGGLKSFCRGSDCFYYKDDEPLVTAARKDVHILCIVASVFAALSLKIMGYFLIKAKDESILYGLAVLFLCVISFCLAFSGAMHFVKTQNDIIYPKDISFRFDYSLHLAWFAAILALAAGILFFFTLQDFIELPKCPGESSGTKNTVAPTPNPQVAIVEENTTDEGKKTEVVEGQNGLINMF